MLVRSSLLSLIAGGNERVVDVTGMVLVAVVDADGGAL